MKASRSVESVSDRLGTKLLTFVLSVIASSVDVPDFLRYRSRLVPRPTRAPVQVSLKNAPSTAVMTTNLTRFVVDLGEMSLGSDPGGRVKAVARARHTGTAIAGFVIGACLGAWCQARRGLWSLVVPAGLALVLVIACS